MATQTGTFLVAHASRDAASYARKCARARAFTLREHFDPDFGHQPVKGGIVIRPRVKSPRMAVRHPKTPRKPLFKAVSLYYFTDAEIILYNLRLIRLFGI